MAKEEEEEEEEEEEITRMFKLNQMDTSVPLALWKNLKLQDLRSGIEAVGLGLSKWQLV